MSSNATSPSAISVERLNALLQECQGLILPNPARCIILAREAYELAKRAQNKTLMGRSLYWVGAGLRQTADLVNAAAILREANTLLFASGDTEFQSRALQGIGAIHSASGELTEAIQCFERALALARANDDPYTITRILNSWAIVAIRQADYDKAFTLYDECLHYLQTSPDAYMEASILSNLGAIYQRVGDYAAALNACERSLAVAGRRDDYRQDANCYVIIADTHCSLGHWTEAKEAITRAIEIAKAHDYVDIEAIAYRTLVEIAKNVGDDAHSIELLEEAHALAEVTGNTVYLQKIEVELGSALTRHGEFERAKAALDRALTRAENAKSPQLLAETHLALAEYFEHALDIPHAVEQLRMALQHNAILQSDANKLAVRRLERRITPENVRRAPASIGLVEAVADAQARLMQLVLARVQSTLKILQDDAQRLGTAGLQIERRAGTISQMLHQLDLVDRLEV